MADFHSQPNYRMTYQAAVRNAAATVMINQMILSQDLLGAHRGGIIMTVAAIYDRPFDQVYSDLQTAIEEIGS